MEQRDLMEQRENQDVLEKEIDLIQSCINRMAQNSFLIKGWMISLLTVLIGLSDKNLYSIAIAVILLVICFWYLDAFFLKTEKLYRFKYEWVIKNRFISNDFFYDLNPYNREMWIDGNVEPSFFKIMFSKTLWPIYFVILVSLIVYYILGVV